MPHEINENQSNNKNAEAASESVSQQLYSDAQASTGVGCITESERDRFNNIQKDLPSLEIWDSELYTEESSNEVPGLRDYLPEKDREKAVDNLVNEIIKGGDNLGKSDEQRDKLANFISDALNFKQSDEAVQKVVDEINKKLKEQGCDFSIALCNPEYVSGVTGGPVMGTLWMGSNYQLNLINKDGQLADSMQVFNMRGMQK